jgi:hypothetical protein
MGAPMGDDDKIYVDAEQPATLNNGAGKLTDYRTLRETVMAWHLLPPEQTKRATIKLTGGPVYTAAEISGSMRAESAVEPTRSENITVT